MYYECDPGRLCEPPSELARCLRSAAAAGAAQAGRLGPSWASNGQPGRFPAVDSTYLTNTTFGTPVQACKPRRPKVFDGMAPSFAVSAPKSEGPFAAAFGKAELTAGNVLGGAPDVAMRCWLRLMSSPRAPSRAAAPCQPLRVTTSSQCRLRAVVCRPRKQVRCAALPRLCLSCCLSCYFG